MRSLNTRSLSLYLYHQLRSRLGSGDETMHGLDLDDERIIRLLLSILNEIPGLEASPAGGSNLVVRFAGSREEQILRLQNIIDSLQIVWKEFQESIGDH